MASSQPRVTSVANPPTRAHLFTRSKRAVGLVIGVLTALFVSSIFSPSAQAQCTSQAVYSLINGVDNSVPPVKVGNAIPFDVLLAAVDATDYTQNCNFFPQSASLEISVSGANASYLSFVSSTTASWPPFTPTYLFEDMIIVSSTTSAVTVDFTLVNTNGGVTLLSTSTTIRVSGTASRLTYSVVEAGETSPNDLSGINNRLTMQSGNNNNIRYQTINDDLEPSALQTTTNVVFTLTGPTNISFSSTGSVLTSATYPMAAFKENGADTTGLTFYNMGPVVQTAVLTASNGVLANTSATIAVYPLAPDRMAISATTNANGFDGFNSGVTTVTVTAGDRDIQLPVTLASYNAFGNMSAVQGSDEDISVSFGNHADLLYTPSTRTFVTSSALTGSTDMLQWFGIRQTTATLTYSAAGLGSTSINVTMNVPDAVAIAASTQASTSNDGRSTTALHLTGATGNFDFVFSTFDSSDNLTATNGNLAPTISTNFTVSLINSGAVTLNAGTSASIDNTVASTNHTLTLGWSGMFSTVATIQVTHLGDGALGTTTFSLTIFPPPATDLAFSSTSIVGFDGIPLTRATFQFNNNVHALPEMVGTTSTISVTSAIYNAIGSLTATSSQITGLFELTGPISETVGSVALTTTGVIFEGNSLTLPYSGPINTVATLQLRVTEGTLKTTTALIGFQPPAATRVAWSTTDPTGQDGFNGGELTVNSQQIINLNFATFNELGNTRVTSASSTLIMRIDGSPFPSNPSIKPTITGVGGVWSGGPAVTSTHAEVHIFGDDAGAQTANRLGTLQFGWLGASPTTITLSLTSATGLVNTSLTVTICPLAPSTIAATLTGSAIAEDNDQFNAGDVSGLGNRFIISMVNRTSAVVPVTVATWNAIDTRSNPKTPVTLATHVFTGFDDFSVTNSLAVIPTSTGQVTIPDLRFTMTGAFARGANFWVTTTGTGSMELQQLPNIVITLLAPAADRLAFSNSTGAGITGFNGGDLTIDVNTPVVTIPVTMATFDQEWYPTATGNNTFPIFFFTTTAIITADAGGDPRLQIVGSSTLTFSPISVTDDTNLQFSWTGPDNTTATFTATHNDFLGAPMMSTSVTVTLIVPEANLVAFSTTTYNGADGFNAGSTTVTLTGTNSTITVTAGTWNALGNLRSTNALGTLTLDSDGDGNDEEFLDAFDFSGGGVTSASITIANQSPWAIVTPVLLDGADLVDADGTTLTVSVIPPAVNRLAFSRGQYGGSVDGTTSTFGFNSGGLTVASGNLYPVTVASFNALNNLRATNANSTLTLEVLGSVGEASGNSYVGPTLALGTTTIGTVNSYNLTMYGDNNGLTSQPGWNPTTFANIALDWRGQFATTAIIRASMPGLFSTSVTVSLAPRPAIRLAFSSTAVTSRDGLPTTIQLDGTNATVSVTMGTYNSVGDLVATTQNVQVFFIQSIAGVPQQFVGNSFMTTASATRDFPLVATVVESNFGSWTGPRPTSATYTTIQFAPQNLVNTTANVTLVPSPADRLVTSSVIPAEVTAEMPLSMRFRSKNKVDHYRVTDATTQLAFDTGDPLVSVTTGNGTEFIYEDEFSTTFNVTFDYTASAQTTVTVTVSTVAPQVMQSTSFTTVIRSKPDRMAFITSPTVVWSGQPFNLGIESRNSGDVAVPVFSTTNVLISNTMNGCVPSTGATGVSFTPSSTATGTEYTIISCCTSATTVTISAVYLSGNAGCTLATTTYTVTVMPAPTNLAVADSPANPVANDEAFDVDLATTVCGWTTQVPVTTNTWVSYQIVSPLSVSATDYLSAPPAATPVTTNFVLTGANGGTTATLFMAGSSLETTTLTLAIANTKASLNTTTAVVLQASVLSGSTLVSTTFTVQVEPFLGYPNQGQTSGLAWLQNSPAVTPVTTAGWSIVPAPKVAVKDQYGNLITNYIGSIDARIGTDASLCGDGELLSRSGSHSTPSTGVVRETIGVGDNGIVIFNGLNIEESGIGYTLYARDEFELLQAATSNTFRVIPNVATQLAFYSEPPAVTTAGVTWAGMQAICDNGTVLATTGTNLVVEVRDQYNNLTTGSITSVEMSINSFSPRVTGAPQGTLTVTPSGQLTSNGRATFANLSIERSGLYTIKVTSGTLNQGVSRTFEIIPDAPVALNWLVDPSDVASGNVMTPDMQVEGLDQYNNRTTNATYTIGLSTSASATLVGNSEGSDVGVSSYDGFRIVAAAGTYQLTATSAGLASTVSGTFEVFSGASELAYSRTARAGTDGFNSGDVSPLDVVSGQILTNEIGTWNDNNTLVDVTSATTLAYSVSATVPPVTIVAGTSQTITQWSNGVTTTNLQMTYNGTQPTTAVITLTRTAGHVLSATSITVTVSPPAAADRLALSTSATGVANAYDGSGLSTTSVMSMVPFASHFQVLNEQLLPRATTSVTTVAYDLLASDGSSRSDLTLLGGTSQALNTTQTRYSQSLTAQWTGAYASTTAILRLQVTAGGQLLETRASITVAPYGTATALSFETQPSASNTAGSAFGTQPEVAVVDQWGNVVQNFTGTVTVAIGTDASECANGVLQQNQASWTILPGMNGRVTLSGVRIDQAGTGYTLQADWQDNTITSATSASFSVVADTPTQWAFESQPMLVTTAGLAFTGLPTAWPCPTGTTNDVVVELQDAYGNYNGAFETTVLLEIGTYTPNVAGAYTSTGTIGGPTFTDQGRATFANVSLDRAGRYTLRARDAFAPIYTAASSREFEVTPDLPASIVFDQQPTDVRCDFVFDPAVSISVYDALSNYVTQQTVTVNLTMQNGTLSGTTTETVGASTGEITYSGLTSVNGLVAGNPHTLTATSNLGAAVQVSNNFNMIQGEIDQIDWAIAPGVVTCEGTTTITVSVVDFCGNPISGEVVTLATTSVSFDGGVMTSTATLVGGSATFTLSDVHGLVSGNPHAVTVTSTNGTMVAGSFTMQQGVVRTIALSPSALEATCEGVTTVTVTISDDCANPVVGENVFLQLPAGVTHGAGLTTANAISDGSGQVSFTLMNVHGSVGNHTLTYNAGPSTTTQTLTITQGVVRQLAVITPTTEVACSENTSATVEVRDDCDNLVVGATVTLTAAGGVTFNGGMTTATAVSDGTGIATFALNGVSGDRDVTYTLTASSNTTSATMPLTVRQGEVTAVAFTPNPTDVGCSESTTLTITVNDACGNLVSGASVSLTAAAGFTFDGGVNVSNATSDASGIATFTLSNVQGLIGTYALTASSNGVDATENIDLTQGTATMAVAGQVSNTVECGDAVTLTASFADNCGNDVVGVNATVTIPGITFAGSATVATDGSGVATWNLTNVQGLVAGNSYTATFTAEAASTSSTIDMAVSAPATVVFNAPLPTTVECAGSTTFTVTVFDDCGNPVPSTTVTLSLSAGITGATAPALTDGSGVATLTLSNVNALVGVYSLLVTAPGTPSTSADITVVPGSANSVAWTTAPTSVTCSSITTLTVAVSDGCGNAVVDGTSVEFTFDGVTQTTATVGGSASVVWGPITQTVGAYAVTATAGGPSTSGTLTVEPGTPSALAAVVAPATAACEDDIVVTVDVTDDCGNAVPNWPVTLTTTTFDFDPANAMAVSATSDAGGVATFTLNNIHGLAGNHVITLATSGASTTTAVTIVPGPVTVVTGAPATQQVTCASTAVVTATLVDDCNNPTDGRVATLTVLTAGLTFDGGLTSITTASNVLGEVSFTLTDMNGLAGNYTIEIESEGVTDQVNIEMIPGAPAAISFVTEPIGGVAGNLVKGGTFAQVPVIQVEDLCGNPIATPNLPVQLTLENNPGGGAIYSAPGAGTAFTLANGQATWTNMAVEKAGVGYTLKATVTLPGGVQAFATSADFDITHFVADQVAFVVQPPATVTAATAFVPDPQVQVQDCFGNHVTNATNVVTMTISNNPGSGTLTTDQFNGIDHSVAAVGGVATFTGVSIDKSGLGYTLGASAVGLTPGFSTGFDVTAGAPAQLAVTVQPSNEQACDAITMTVQVQDAGGNHVTNANGFNVITGLLNNDGTYETASITGTLLETTVGGEAVFTDLHVDKVGTYQLIVGELNALLTTTASASFTISEGPAAQVGFNLQPQSITKVDDNFANVIQVHVEDCGGNQLLTDNDTQLTLDIDPANNPTNTTLIVDDNTVTTVAGNGSFTNLRIIEPGTYRLRVTGTNVLNVPLTEAYSDFFTIIPGVANTTQSTVVVNNGLDVEVGGSTLIFDVVKRDQFGYITTCGTVDVTLTDNGTGGASSDVASIGEGTTSATVTYTSGTTAGVSIANMAFTIGGSDIQGMNYDINQYAQVAVAAESSVSASGLSAEVCTPNALTFTVTKRDQFTNETTRGTVDVVANLAGAGVGAAVSGTEIADGISVGTIDYTSGTTAGIAVATVGFEIGGTDIVNSPLSIDQTAGTADATRSTVVAAATSVEVSNNSNTIDVTITRRDKAGNLTETGAVDISLTEINSGGAMMSTTAVAGAGPVQVVQYQSGTMAAAPAASINATIGGSAIVGSGIDIDQYAGPATSATSTIAADAGTSVEVGPANSLSFTVNLFDQFMNPTTNGQAVATFTDNGSGGGAAAGMVGPGVVSGQVTYTAGTVAGANVGSYGATIDGTAVQGSGMIIEQTAATADATTSTIALSGSDRVEVGGATTTLDVNKFDAYGNPTTLGTVSVALSNDVSAGGALDAASVADGTKMQTLTYSSGTNAADPAVTVDATIGGTAIAGSGIDIEQFAGVATSATTTLSGNDRVEVGGQLLGLTIDKQDIFGNPTTRGTVALALTDINSVGASLSQASVADGVQNETFNYISGTMAANPAATVSATIGGTDVSGSSMDIEQYAATAHAAMSTIAGPAEVTVAQDGTISVEKYDVFGNPTTRGTVTMVLTNAGTGGASLSPLTVDEGTQSQTSVFTAGTIAPSTAVIDATTTGGALQGSPVSIDQIADAATQLVVENASDGIFTANPATLDAATRQIEFTATVGVRDQFMNVTTANIDGSLSGTAGASGSYAETTVSSFTVGVTPQVAGNNLTVVFSDTQLSATTLTITTVYDILSLTYPTPHELTRFQPSVTINPNRFGGRPPFTYDFVAGSDALPAGLVMNAGTGVITGVPTTATVFPLAVDIKVTDFNGVEDDAQVIFTVNPAMTIYYPTTATVYQNQSASIAAQITGGTSPYDFQLTSGALPTGLTLDGPTGTISGIPTTTGSYTITVTATDANGAMDNASMTVVVIPQANVPTALNLRVALQGPQTGSTSGTLMGQNLNTNGLLPLTDPYAGTTTVASIPLTAVDWVEVELRTGTSANSSVTTAIGFVRTDGMVVGLDGTSQLLFDATTVPAGDYYVVVRHRNHLWVMSAQEVTLTANTSALYDFTSGMGQAYSEFQDPQIQTGAFGQVAGDADISNRGVINAADRVAVRNATGSVNVYIYEDVTLDGIVNAADRVISRNNTFRATQVP